ncbi:MAG: hypothetical protein GY795_31440 [Desulfobacterales bacterium]|nr:hypothetical protein [Desulfobacterales bacterium]
MKQIRNLTKKIICSPEYYTIFSLILMCFWGITTFPRSFLAGQILFSLAIIFGVWTILLSQTLSDPEKRSENLMIRQKAITLIYLVLAVLLAVYSYQLNRLKDIPLSWKVLHYKYGDYNSDESGCKEGFHSGQMDGMPGKRKTTGAIGFGFYDKNENLIALPVYKNKLFTIKYRLKTPVPLIFSAVFEELPSDAELTSSRLYIIPDNNSDKLPGILKITIRDDEYKKISTCKIKHLKTNYSVIPTRFDHALILFLYKFHWYDIISEAYLGPK